MGIDFASRATAERQFLLASKRVQLERPFFLRQLCEEHAIMQIKSCDVRRETLDFVAAKRWLRRKARVDRRCADVGQETFALAI